MAVRFDPALHARSLEELHAVLFARQNDDDNDCKDCGKPEKCPPCEGAETCVMSIPDNCRECATNVCVIEDDESSGDSSGSDKDDDGPNTGAIAGGVVGGVVAIVVITYLVWRYCIKPRRRPSNEDEYDDSATRRVGSEKDVAETQRDKRSSVHTVHSIASTVLTRASNIIQIAYIPGVTNRATPSSPGVLVPPVPPIPMHASSSVASSPSYEDQHFFTPGALRDSTYSGLSRDSDRQSYARSSYAPRASMAPSIASTIYGKNAVVVAPAQTGMRAKAAMVSVKSIGGNGTGDENVPAVPSIDYNKYDASQARDSTFSVGSTFLNSANTAVATPARAQVVRLGSSGNQVKQVSVGSKTDSNHTNSESPSPAISVTSPDSQETTAVAGDSPMQDQGPFSDPPVSPSSNGHQSTTSLSAVIEEATKRAAKGPDRRSKRESHEGPPQERGTSPFGDEHATRE